MNFSWKSVVKGASGLLGTMLGGPHVGLAVGALADQFLGEDEKEAAKEQGAKGLLNAVKDVVKTQQFDPDFALKMRAAEDAVRLKLRELDIEEEEIHQRDRSSARSMRMATDDWTPDVLSYIYTFAFFALLGFLCWAAWENKVFPKGVGELLYVCLGALLQLVIGVKEFWLGSSRSEQVKDGRAQS